MSGPEIGFAIASLAMSAVGTGMQYSAQKQAAANQDALARYNYAVQAQNIRQQQAIAQQQAAYQAQVQEANAAIARQTAETQARTYEQNAGAALRQGVEEQRRSREDYLRLQARQNANFGKSGVLATADAQADLAAKARLAAADAWFLVNEQSNDLQYRAELSRYEGRMGSANYGMQAALYRAEGDLAPIRARADMRRAELGRMMAYDEASSRRSMATAGLVSNTGTILGDVYGYYNAGAFSGLFGKKTGGTVVR